MLSEATNFGLWPTAARCARVLFDHGLLVRERVRVLASVRLWFVLMRVSMRGCVRVLIRLLIVAALMRERFAADVRV